MAEQAMTVTEALGLAKGALEGVRVTVIGEVSEVTDKPGYKAVYFTLVDGRSVMPCLAWRDDYSASGVDLRVGALVQVSGGFTLYAAKGRMQFQARRIQPAGEGALRMRVAALSRALEAEGLMGPERKRPIPVFPRRVGLVTSPRGKAVHDVLRTLRRRFPCAEIVFAGVAVEGADAVAEIVSGMRAVGLEPGVDVVILCRGGGSYEDLMPFNDEAVARAIVASPAPVVTGIGHEPDTCIADMVADLRASTPTAAAEAVAPTAEEIERRFAHLYRSLARALQHRLQSARHSVELLSRRPVLHDAGAFFSAKAQALDLASDSLSAALPARVRRESERLLLASHGLLRTGPRLADKGRHALDLQSGKLDGLSPLDVLKRGYAVCFDASGRRALHASAEAAVGERVRVRLAAGALGCIVEDTFGEEA